MNYKYIFNNLYIPYYVKNIIEPFFKNNDILNIIDNKLNYNIECCNNYNNNIYKASNYKNKFIISEIPKENNIYKEFIKEISNDNNKCIGGIIILPFNFWFSDREKDIELRKIFLQKYNVIQLNVFKNYIINSSCLFELKRDNNIIIPITINENINKSYSQLLTYNLSKL